ncbi:MAG: hypothetical protein AAB851_02675, partial [Patescibacteria group bacterium]
ELAAKKFWPPARARRKGGVGEFRHARACLPDRPGVPPERLPAEASAQARSAPSVLFKKGSDFVKQTHQLKTPRFQSEAFF